MLKNLNLFEKVATIIGLLITLIVGIINKSEILSLINGLLNIFNSTLTSAGRIETHYFALVSFILYIIITIKNHLFGETIFTLVVCIPSTIISIINWRKNLDKEGTVNPVKVNKKEIGLVIFSQILMFYPYYLIFGYFKTEHLY